MPDKEKSRSLSNYRLALSEETLRNAKMCLDNNFYRDCINRSYYAAFYATKAILALDNVDFKRHKDAVAYFNKHYVATELLDREVGKRLGRLKMIREESDYSDFFIASKEEAKNQYENADFIINKIKSFL